MIGLFDDQNNRLAVTYNGLTLNDPGDPDTQTFQLDGWSESEDLFYYKEPQANDDGSEAYKVTKKTKVLHLMGTIRALSSSELCDRIHALASTFDAARVSHENPGTQGFLPLAFSVPTEDTTNYPTGLVDSLLYCRPLAAVIPAWNSNMGTSAYFEIVLEAIDPVRYDSSAQSQSVPSTIDNSLATYRSYPVLTIHMSGAGSSTFKLTNTTFLGAIELDLDLSHRATGDIITIDFGDQTIVLAGGTDLYAEVYKGGQFWPLEPAENVISSVNGSGITSLSMAWKRGFSA